LFLLVLLSSYMWLSSSVSVGAAESVGVYIRADGTVEGTSSILRNGDVYTFVADFVGPLYVEKHNIVIDGAGHTVTGGRGRGVVLASDVTLKNARIVVDGGYIVDVGGLSDCVLVGNTLVGNPQPIPGLPAPKGPLVGPIGVNFLHSQRITFKDNTVSNFSSGLSLEWSSGHTITGNTFVDGFVGIDLWDSTGCVFRNNRMINSSFSIRVYPGYGYENDLDSSNTIDGKPIYYWLSHRDEVVPSNAGYVVLVNSTNIKLENASPKGIVLVSTANSTIRGVRMTGRGDGITLLDSSGISILDSVLHGPAIGIQVENSWNNTISRNEISSTMTRGMNLDNASNNVISGNTFTNNSYSIAPFQDSVSDGNVVTSNLFRNNSFALTVHGSMSIRENVFEDNDQAVLLSGSSGSVISENTFTGNNFAVYISASSGNSFYHNNFINNTHDVADAGASGTQSQPAKANSNPGSLQLASARVNNVNFIPPPPPSTNRWDDGSKGNYWDKYTGSDANGDGVGDTPYRLYENNQDNYPLMKPVAVADVPSLPIVPSGPSSENQTSPDDTQGPSRTGTELPEFPAQYVFAALAVVGIVAICVWSFVRRRKVRARESDLQLAV
jgi:parallel beta-helix repeat protein